MTPPARTRPAARRRAAASWILLACTAVALAGCASWATNDPAAGAGGLLVSTTPSRAAPYPLDGATVRGDVYVFVAIAPENVERVTFYLTSEPSGTELIRVADATPFDLMGTTADRGLPWDTRTVADGAHRLDAEVVRRDGGVEVLSAAFVVANEPDAGDRWRPTPGTSWQWQLTGTIDTSVDADVFDLDLFDVPVAVIDDLHARGRKVICYFSAGTFEPWRPDADAFDDEVLGEKMSGWDEYWLDVRRLDLLGPVFRARLDLAAAKGCDGVEPDNVDGYQNRTGFELTYDDQLAFNRFLAVEAHARGLAIGLKNDLDQVRDLVGDFDFAVNEECYQWNECHLLSPFVDAGKAVFGAEYGVATAEFCPVTNALDLDFILKRLDLGAWRETCR
jgi:hypothetical protein